MGDLAKEKGHMMYDYMITATAAEEKVTAVVTLQLFFSSLIYNTLMAGISYRAHMMITWSAFNLR